jgi:hypothetical protein
MRFGANELRATAEFGIPPEGASLLTAGTGETL